MVAIDSFWLALILINCDDNGSKLRDILGKEILLNLCFNSSEVETNPADIFSFLLAQAGTVSASKITVSLMSLISALRSSELNVQVSSGPVYKQ